MSPRFAALAGVMAGLLALPSASIAQQWNDDRTIALVDRAIARRAAQLADTGLADYHATAHGYLTFLAQVGEGFPDPPRVVRTDELAVDVSWRAPNQSKQRLVGRRDTLLLPTDINYHRDHLAIVQNNFPSIIRLGDGDEVRDVPHPLSAAGRAAYDFVVADSLTIRTNDRVFDVVMVKVRPKDDRQPRAVGAVYLDRANGSVVRMTFSFTRHALKDPLLEDVSVMLDNGLVEGRFWLPRRQEIEIRRSGSWMDFPARGIIRGRWEICCVTVNNRPPPATFAGEEIVAAPLDEQRHYPFRGGILDGLPEEVTLGENDDVRRVQAEARSLVRAEALARTRVTEPAARSVSDLVRVNRNEGLAFGAGVARRFGAGVSASSRVRFGTGDHAFKESVTLAWQRASGRGASVTWHDDYRDAGDAGEVSGLRNTVAAQETGSDFTDYYRARGVGLALDAGVVLGTRWRLSLERERQEPLAVMSRPASGRYAPAFGAEPLAATRLVLEARRSESASLFGLAWHASGAAIVSRAQFAGGPRDGVDATFGRVAMDASLERAFGAGRLVVESSAAATVGPVIPIQSAVFLGGPRSAPGYDYHQLGAGAGATGRLEWRHHAFSFPVPLGRFGELPVGVTIAPYAVAAWIDRPLVGRGGGSGWFPSLGVGALTFFEVVRIDVARGLRGGRWALSIDVSRDLWPIL